MSHSKYLLVGLCLLAAQNASAWRAPSPHQVRFVTVDSSVRLEVLDGGGTGRAIVFVGGYLTAHVYDDIAPQLTDRFHVYAVTRCGVGASDRPAAGYDPQRRTADILEVIDSVGMQKPILVGNSCGGAILHTPGVPAATIVELPGASLYMFLSNEGDVRREIRAFAATLR